MTDIRTSTHPATTADAPPHLRVVVGFDGSPASMTALRRAARMTAGMGGNVRVVSAWSTSALLGADVFVPPVDTLDETLRALQRDAVVEVFGPTPAAHVTAVVREGRPAQVLVEESEDAGLVIVGSRGHGGFAGLLLGSVSMACAEHAHCDVLVVRDR